MKLSLRTKKVLKISGIVLGCLAVLIAVAGYSAYRGFVGETSSGYHLANRRAFAQGYLAPA